MSRILSLEKHQRVVIASHTVRHLYPQMVFSHWNIPLCEGLRENRTALLKKRNSTGSGKKIFWIIGAATMCQRMWKFCSFCQWNPKNALGLFRTKEKSNGKKCSPFLAISFSIENIGICIENWHLLHITWGSLRTCCKITGKWQITVYTLLLSVSIFRKFQKTQIDHICLPYFWVLSAALHGRVRPRYPNKNGMYYMTHLCMDCQKSKLIWFIIKIHEWRSLMSAKAQMI